MYRTQLDTHLEAVYAAFSKYSCGGMDGCPHCTSNTDSQALAVKELHELEPKDLSKYAFKAITTWGNDKNYKYFLPRILDLSLTNFEAQSFPGFSISVILGKLTLMGDDAKEWVASERNSLGDILLLLWDHFLSNLGIKDDDKQPFPWMTEEEGLQCLQLGLRFHSNPVNFQTTWKKYVLNGSGIYIFPTRSGKLPLRLSMPDAVSSLGNWLIDPALLWDIQERFYQEKDPTIQEKLSKIEFSLQANIHLVRESLKELAEKLH